MVRRFHPEIQEYLQGLPRPIDSSAPIFPTLSKKTTGSACGLSNQFAKLVARAGIEAPRGAEKHGPAGRRTRTLCFHSLRHSFNSRLANADVSIDTRKVMVGHASNVMNERYTRGMTPYIDNDGKIWVPVRAEGAGGLVGDAFEPLPIDHPDYERLRVFLEAASDGGNAGGHKSSSCWPIVPRGSAVSSCSDDSGSPASRTASAGL